MRDVLKVLSARFPNAHVTVWPVAVQGASAPDEIARAVEAFSRHSAADVVIVARGGGSRDDLSAFNDEKVVRAVAASRIPTISAVGHEIDVTLTDLAADLRAATPSQAAELVVARRDDFEARIDGLGRELTRTLKGRAPGGPRRRGPAAERSRPRRVPGADGLAVGAGFLGGPGAPLRGEAAPGGVSGAPSPGRRGGGVVAGPGGLPSRPRARARRANGRWRSGWSAASAPRASGSARSPASLSALDPLRVLARGYSVTYVEGAKAPLVDAEGVAPGDALRIVLARGTVKARVTDISKDGAR